MSCDLKDKGIETKKELENLIITPIFVFTVNVDGFEQGTIIRT